MFFRNLFFVAKQKESSKNQAGVNREQLLQLALAWDAIEVAKEQIIKDDLNDITVSSKKILFFKLLFICSLKQKRNYFWKLLFLIVHNLLILL